MEHKFYNPFTEEEKQRFREGLELYGKDWSKVEEHVKTRTGSQILAYALSLKRKVSKDTTQTHLKKLLNGPTITRRRRTLKEVVAWTDHEKKQFEKSIV